MKKKISIHRRSFIQGFGCASLGVWGNWNGINFARGQAGGTKKLLQIFLDGGWDSGLATDPIVGTKASSNIYDSAYSNYTVDRVAQKENLIIGQGLIPAKNAFASMNTCFINGIFMEVTAHELAKNYLYSGTMSLSRSREYPAFIARIGNSGGSFPPFVALGQGVPLGETKSNPPLHSRVANQLKEMLNPFGNTDSKVINTANKLVDSLNSTYNLQISVKEKERLSTWYNSQERIGELYANAYNLTLTDELKTDFSITQDWEENANFPVALLALSSGMTPYVSMSISGFDTHTSHFDTHLPLLEGFSSRLNTLVEKMKTTADPDDSSKMLSETTNYCNNE